MEPLRLEYSRVIKRIQVWSVVASMLVLLGVGGLNYHFFSEHILPIAILKLIFSVSIPLTLLHRLLFLVGPHLYSAYLLHSDRLEIRRGNHLRVFNFSEIRGVRVSWLSPRFFGGFRLLTMSGQSLPIWSTLPDNHLILERLSLVKPELSQDPRVQGYLKVMPLVRLSWERMGESFNRSLALKVTLLPALLTLWFIYGELEAFSSQVLWEKILGNFFVEALAVLLLLFGANVIEENLFYHWCGGNRNSKLERQLRWASQTSFIVSLLFYILVRLEYG